MQRIRQFFLFCSGAHVALLKRAPAETNKYAGIGATIFFTGLLAAISAGYALWTVFGEVWAALLFGAVWGLMIFNLDRYIVSSLKKRDRFWDEFKLAIPRLALALVIAIVISRPLELRIFDKEIQAELVTMEQQVFKKQEDKVKERYQVRMDELHKEIAQLNAATLQQAARRDTLLLLAQQEADGTGGSRIRNLGPIYKAKKADADQAAASVEQLAAINNSLINGKRAALQSIDSTMKAEIRAMNRSRLDGLASRLDALGHLTASSEPIRWASWFIMLLFIAIETAPVFVKLISPRGPYDDLLEQHEHIFRSARQEKITLRDQAREEKLTVEKAVSEHRQEAEINKGQQLTNARVAAETDVEKARLHQWKKEKTGDYY
ncbi:DUF4407 domain-containing protein [Chitinophaga pendula]|uniref:DUF4407 domain-containing protein n=1 Tax=Chitinophaga TaxID=79328 RepID=UPI000BAFCE9D|nr:MULTISPECIES: DUF4407 domain-containing protein [Chitinophaga]ASZ14425.1 hypothetical protein CK934_27515 [Chitinophaga sp. MD30]UCJ07919.1 DUF4407 domain-containing protein [Chitinophaga pendula]